MVATDTLVDRLTTEVLHLNDGDLLVVRVARGPWEFDAATFHRLSTQAQAALKRTGKRAAVVVVTEDVELSALPAAQLRQIYDDAMVGVDTDATSWDHSEPA